MKQAELLALLQQVRDGDLNPASALERILPAASFDFATIDLERQKRCGFPEVVFAEGKTCEWLLGAVGAIHGANQDCLATRVNDDQAVDLRTAYPSANQDRLARTFWLPIGPRIQVSGQVAVITAGTSDLPVAKEAQNTADAIGAKTVLIADVGVAGLHRLLRRIDEIRGADAIVVVAGMDGALPSVVGGLVACPVIAVPTSTGYGTAFGGLAALLTMLNACAANVVTVNIDAGFKAGFVAAMIARGKNKTGGD
ncbi:MAG: nickel pincer cofactor biosynthesis protein LarB [Gemmataceae bacterium]